MADLMKRLEGAIEELVIQRAEERLAEYIGGPDTPKAAAAQVALDVILVEVAERLEELESRRIFAKKLWAAISPTGVGV